MAQTFLKMIRMTLLLLPLTDQKIKVVHVSNTALENSEYGAASGQYQSFSWENHFSKGSL